MSKNIKTKTLFANNKNVDIKNTLKDKIQLGGKKNKKDNDSEISLDEVEVEDDDFDNEEDDNNEDISIQSEEINVDKNDDDEIVEDEEEEENNSDDNVSEINTKEKDDYIGDEETLKNKCYSKYASLDYDEIDLDELFGDDEFHNIKNVRLSKPILTKYERVRLLSVRSRQLAQGAKPMLKNTSGLSSKEVALLELKHKIIPLDIERPIPNCGVEKWKLSELEILDFE